MNDEGLRSKRQLSKSFTVVIQLSLTRLISSQLASFASSCCRFLSRSLLSMFILQRVLIDHFTVVCLVAWPLNESEAGVDLVLIETSLLLLCKFLLISMRTASLA